MSSSATHQHQVAGAPASQPAFPDEILEEIFVRLDAAADLARASAACTSFRRVVSARRFLRRFRSLHPPPVLGFLKLDAFGRFRPAEPPHGSAPAARAFAQAADFTFSFIGTPKCWRVCDARDGRVLLLRRINITATFPYLMVCDPLHRRYVQLPPIPEDLVASPGSLEIQQFDPFLVPANDNEEDLSFRVIYAVHCRYKLIIVHFSSVTGKWRDFTFDRTTPLNDLMVTDSTMFVRHYAHGFFFWTFPGMRSLVILDPREMKFSVIDHPPGSLDNPRAQAIIEVWGGRLGLINLCGDNLVDCTLELYSKALQNNGFNTEVWQHDKMIPLPEMDCQCRWAILDKSEGYLLLQATPRDYAHSLVFEQRALESHCFTLDLKTLLFERLCMSNHYSRVAHLYAGFPPTLSPPSI